MDRTSGSRASRRTSEQFPPGRSFSRILTGRKASDVGPDEQIGAFGLTTLYKPLHGVVADVIFVHGLGGGSQKTWTRNADPTTFWPLEWLPHDKDFRDVRIHTFGYDSKWEKGSILDIGDFAKSLLQWVTDCPDIGQNEEKPLYFVCHSMGGLVAKQAYIIARQDQQYVRLGAALRAIFFLATPHRGSDLADVLRKILNLSTSARPYVVDLVPRSKAIQSINEDFPRFSDNLQLHSFYETLPTHMGPGVNSLIVKKESAVLGYPNERSTYLDADHRGVCKFESRTSPNYKSVRNALAAAFAALRSGIGLASQDSFPEQQQNLNAALGISDSPEDDYSRLESTKTPGSCEWISKREAFQTWRNEGHPYIYWITAKPGAGKSMLCGHVVKTLRDADCQCSFFFFTHTIKATLSVFFRSIAWQLAAANPEIFEHMAKICKREPKIHAADHRTLWRKLFVECIFKHRPDRPHYWVVDAVDECKQDSELAGYLMQAAATTFFRVFVTSRTVSNYHGVEGSPKNHICVDTIGEATTNEDIKKFLAEQQKVTLAKGPTYIAEQLLARADGCFLWTTLVVQALRQGLTRSGIQKILDEVPTGMDDLYDRIVHAMFEQAREHKIITAVLEWTTCAVRLLTTKELHDALRLDMNDEIDGDVKRFVESNCGQLVVVDEKDRVRMIHLTASEFLFSAKNTHEHRFSRAKGHRRLAMACLRYLMGAEMPGARPRRSSSRQISNEQSTFASYAAFALFDHIAFIHSDDDDFVVSLVKFLKSSNVLSWIEYVARHFDLSRLVHAGTALRKFVARRSQKMLPFGNLSKDNAFLERWATDLVRLVTKFGTYLKTSPASVANLIAPFCPADSAMRTQFASSKRAISVTGVTSTAWDDCASTMVLHETINAVASTPGKLAIGSLSGQVVIYDEKVYQQEKILDHGEPVKWIIFGTLAPVIVAAGLRWISVWDTATWELRWRIEHHSQFLSLALDNSDEMLLATCRSNEIRWWNMSDGTPGVTESWLDESLEESARRFRRPHITAVSADGTLLAIAYRGEDVTVWDVDQCATHDIIGRGEGSLGPTFTPRTGVSIATSMIFSGAVGEAKLLVICYNDGIMQLFDTEQGDLLATTHANAQTLASSNDGLTLACGGSDGKIKILEFETLKPLYSIQAAQTNIKQLTFSADDQRLYGIQQRCCYAWDPPVLVRQHIDEENSDTVSVSTGPQDVTVKDPVSVTAITAIAPTQSGTFIFCGREDGGVYLHNTTEANKTLLLLRHAKNVEVTLVEWDPVRSILVTVDVSSRIMAHKLIQTTDGGFEPGDCIVDFRVGETVVQVLLNRGAQRILVSTELEDILLSLDTERLPQDDLAWREVDRRSSPTQRSHKWSVHPQRPDQLILVSNNSAHIFSWSSLAELSQPSGLRLLGIEDHSLAITSICSCFDSSYLAMTFADSSSSNARSEILFYPTSALRADVAVLEPDPAFLSLAGRVHVLVGTGKSQRLVFLDQDGWVCSAASAASFNIDQYDRHHFLPADWLSGVARLRLEVCAKDGSLLFVRRDELICIRKGLEQLENGHGKAFSKRPSLKSGSLSEESILEDHQRQRSIGTVMGARVELSERLRRARSTPAQTEDSYHFH